MTRKRKKDGLESEVLNIGHLIGVDKEGRYIPFCDYFRHRGIIEREEICFHRKCKYYQLLRIK